MIFEAFPENTKKIGDVYVVQRVDSRQWLFLEFPIELAILRGSPPEKTMSFFCFRAFAEDFQ